MLHRKMKNWHGIVADNLNLVVMSALSLFKQLHEEFSALHPEARPLRNMWCKYQDHILHIASNVAVKDPELKQLFTDWEDLDQGEFNQSYEHYL